MDARTPSIVTLIACFSDLTREDAKLIRALCKAVDERDTLEALIEDRCEATATYARSCYHIPWGSAMWRRTMVLHALDVICGTCGVEAIGSSDVAPYSPPYEYLNTGDTYAATLVYNWRSDTLFVSSWGNIAERMPRGND